VRQHLFQVCVDGFQQGLNGFLIASFGVKVNPVMNPDHFGNIRLARMPVEEWDKTLVVLRSVFDLQAARLGRQRVRADDKHEIICGFDPVVDLTQPICGWGMSSQSAQVSLPSRVKASNGCRTNGLSFLEYLKNT
jgi:hypothetical protein